VSDSRSNSVTEVDETARDYSAGTSVIHFQIFFQCIMAYGRKGQMKALYSWERDFWRDPTMQRLWSGVL